MNTLEQLVNQRVLEEGLKKAKPLAAQMGLESVPDEMLEMICPNLTELLWAVYASSVREISKRKAITERVVGTNLT